MLRVGIEDFLVSVRADGSVCVTIIRGWVFVPVFVFARYIKGPLIFNLK